jgi:hypothetical protein
VNTQLISKRDLGSSLRHYADRPELHWVPSAVVADVVHRRRPSPWKRGWLLSAAAVVVVLAVGVAEGRHVGFGVIEQIPDWGLMRASS